MADYGRVSSVIGEVAVEVPTGDAKGRVSNVIGEAAVEVPLADAKGRVSNVFAEAAVSDGTDLMRVNFVMVEVFSQATTTPTPRPALGGGVQGARVSSIRRRR